jgi:hypothetical protein
MGFDGRVAPAVVSLLTCTTLLAVLTSSGMAREGSASASTPGADLIVQKMMAANARRSQGLRAFTGKRSYRVDYHGFLGGREADMQVLASFTAPDKKDFKIISESGSKLLINHVFLKLLDSEKEYLEESTRLASELSPRNYEFIYLGQDHTSDGDFYILGVSPRERSEFLYKGKIWVDMHDYAVARIQGEPAKNPSMWISHTEIDHHYQKVGDFWLPARNESVTQVRLGGKAVLTIDYSDYKITAVNQVSPGPVPGNEPVLPNPSTVTADPH